MALLQQCSTCSSIVLLLQLWAQSEATSSSIGATTVLLIVLLLYCYYQHSCYCRHTSTTDGGGFYLKLPLSVSLYWRSSLHFISTLYTHYSIRVYHTYWHRMGVYLHASAPVYSSDSISLGAFRLYCGVCHYNNNNSITTTSSTSSIVFILVVLRVLLYVTVILQ